MVLGFDILELSRVGIAILGADYKVVWVNQTLEGYLGISRAALIGRDQRQLITEQLKDIFDDADNLIRRVLAAYQVDTGVETFECHILAGPRRQERWLEYWSQPIRAGPYAGGRLEQYTDITEHNRDKQTLARRNRELALLNRASQVFMSTLDLNQVSDTVLDEAQRLLGVMAYSIWLLEPKSGELICHKATGPKNELVKGWHLAHGAGIAGWVADHGQSLIVPDTRLDQRHFKEIDQQIQIEIRSILSIPLRVKKQVIGVLQMVDTEVNRFDATHLELVESLAATAAIAIEKAQLYERAMQDAQTKLILLHEVNHRVKNNLATIIGLLYAERRRAGVKQEPIYQEIIHGLIGRVQGLATVHNLLSASEWTPLQLSTLAAEVVQTTLKTLPYHKQVTVQLTPSPIYVTPKQANHLALILNELTTNTIKYALAERNMAQITIQITLEPADLATQNRNSLPKQTIRLEFRDDGPGYPDEVLNSNHHQVGLYLIQTIVKQDLGGQLRLYNDQGAITIIQINHEAQGEQDEPV
jgi:PAS domain S-box-containing protein